MRWGGAKKYIKMASPVRRSRSCVAFSAESGSLSDKEQAPLPHPILNEVFLIVKSVCAKMNDHNKLSRPVFNLALISTSYYR